MVSGEGGARSLVAIVIVLLLGRVAEADNPCYAKCFQRCTGFPCSLSPACIGGCAYACGQSDTCDHISFLPQNIDGREQANAIHYCKLGCASSVCSSITTALHRGSSAGHIGEEAVKESVERCNNACSEACTKRSRAAAITA